MNIKELKEKYLEKLEFLHKEEIRKELEYKKEPYPYKLAELANVKGQVFTLEQLEKDLEKLED